MSKKPLSLKTHFAIASLHSAALGIWGSQLVADLIVKPDGISTLINAGFTAFSAYSLYQEYKAIEGFTIKGPGNTPPSP